MAEETHPEISRVVFSDLSRFMTETDGKIQLLLAEFVAEDNEMTWVVEALECYQESLKKKVRDVRSVVFDSDSEGEAYDAIAAALARSFLKDEEVIVARLGLCRKLLGGVPMLRREDSGQTSDAPDEHEEAQELDGVDPESGVEGGPVEEARHEEPKEDSKPPSDSNQSSDVLEKREEGEDLDVIDAQRSNEESGVAETRFQVLGSPPEEENLEAVLPETETETETCVSLKEDLIDARLSNRCENPNGDGDSKLSSDLDSSSDVPAKCEEEQDLDKTDPEGSESGEESQVGPIRVRVKDARNEKPDEEYKLTSDSDRSSESSVNSEERADQVPDVAIDESVEESRVAEGPVAVSSPRPLTPSIVSGSPPDKENPQAVIPASERIVSFSELIRFIGRVDRKIESLLMGFKEGGRDSPEVEGTKISQDQLKDRLGALTEVYLKAVDDGENLEVVVYSEMRMMALKALGRSLMEQERAIDARVDKLLAASVQVTAPGNCSKHLGKSDAEEQNERGVEATQFQDVQNENPKEENNLTTDSDPSSDVTATREEGQGLDKIDSEGSKSVEESGIARSRVEVEEARNEKPNEEHELTSDSDHSVDVSVNSEEWADQVLDAATDETAEESRVAEDPATGEGLIETRLSSCSQHSVEVQDEKPKEYAKLSSNSSRSSEVPAGSPKSVIPESETIDAVRVTALLDKAEVEEPSDDDKVLGPNCTVDTGRLEEKKSSVAIEDKLKPRKDRVRADHFRGPRAMEEFQMTLQKRVAEGLKHRAVEVQIKLAILLAEIFLLLSTNNKKMAEKEFQAFVSCLEDIDRDKSDVNVVKPIIQVLKMAKEELSKVGKSSHAREDEENQMPEALELLDNAMILIAHLDVQMNFMGQFESRLLADKAIQGFEKGMKDMQKQLLGMESALELLGSRFSCRDFAPVLNGISDALLGLSSLP